MTSALAQPAAVEAGPRRVFSQTGLVFVCLLGAVLSWRAQFFVPGPNQLLAIGAVTLDSQPAPSEIVAPPKTEPGGGGAAKQSAQPPAAERALPPPVWRQAVEPVVSSGYALEIKDPRPIRAELSFEVQAAKFTATDWVVFAAKPPILPSQLNTVARLLPAGQDYVEPAPSYRTLLRSHLKISDAARNVDSHRLRVRVEYQASLVSRELVLREPGKHYPAVGSLTLAERAACLEDNELLDYRSPPFQAWLRTSGLSTRGKAGDVDFGRRVFWQLKKSLHYEYKPKMDRRASEVCHELSSDCAGMSVLFASILRSHGIPARVLAGRWAKSSRPGQMVDQVKYYQQHVRAEFYAAGVGWVPVDLASAVERDPSPAGLRFFGHDRGDFLVLHIDPIIHVDTLYFGEKTLLWLQGVHYWGVGRGSLADAVIDETWHVEPTVQRASTSRAASN